MSVCEYTRLYFLFARLKLTMEAVAKHDFTATADDELSFRKNLTLKVSGIALILCVCILQECVGELCVWLFGWVGYRARTASERVHRLGGIPQPIIITKSVDDMHWSSFRRCEIFCVFVFPGFHMRFTFSAHPLMCFNNVRHVIWVFACAGMTRNNNI